MSRAVAFLDAPRPLDYGSRLSRLRWCRAARVTPGAAVDWTAAGAADEALRGAGSWVVVRDAEALPVPGGRVPEPPYGRVLVSRDAVPAPPAYVHTLRELERAPLETVSASGDSAAAALAFWAADVPARAGERVAEFVARLLESEAHPRVEDPAFRVVRFEDPSSRERSELTRRLPDGPLRILDVGCGAGGALTSAARRRSGWDVTGIERDASLAARARERCDVVLEGDLREILPRLARDGARFDALVFADVLEHLEDPFEPLRCALALASPGARLLVSVPNVGNLSVARDLLCGRFDPVPAGLSDAGHLRWFTRGFLAEVLEESGWVSGVSIRAEPGAPSPEPEAFREMARSWPDRDDESLDAYQWIAEATAP